MLEKNIIPPLIIVPIQLWSFTIELELLKKWLPSWIFTWPAPPCETAHPGEYLCQILRLYQQMNNYFNYLPH